jgi:AcrR family transcriptional regulator
MTEPKKGRKPKYTKENIIAAAVTHADKYGLEEVTMAKVAKQVGCTPMALYSHVESHDALLRAMADRALSELDREFPKTSSWQEGISLWLQTLWQASTQRQWLVEVIMVNERISLQWLKYNEKLVALLEQAGMNDKQIADSLSMIGCISVSAIYQVTQFPLPRNSVIEGGLTEKQADQLDINMWARMVPFIQAHTNQSFLKEMEQLVIWSIEGRLK